MDLRFSVCFLARTGAMTSKVFYTSELMSEETRFQIAPCRSQRARGASGRHLGMLIFILQRESWFRYVRQHQISDCPLGYSSGMTASTPGASHGCLRTQCLGEGGLGWSQGGWVYNRKYYTQDKRKLREGWVTKSVKYYREIRGFRLQKLSLDLRKPLKFKRQSYFTKMPNVRNMFILTSIWGITASVSKAVGKWCWSLSELAITRS